MYTLLASYKTWGFNWKARHRSLIRVLLIPSPQPANRRKTESNLGVWGSAAPPNLQTINIPLWIGVWCEGRADHRDGWHWFQKILRGNMRGWLEDNGFHWTVSMVKFSTKQPPVEKTNIWYFFLFYQARRKKNYPYECPTIRDYGNIKHQTTIYQGSGL